MTEAWELSSLTHKLNNMHSHLTKQLDRCHQHIGKYEESKIPCILTEYLFFKFLNKKILELVGENFTRY